MSIEAKRRGWVAEQRVYDLSIRSGFRVRFATTIEDGAMKIDVIIEEVPIQVSCSQKSKRQRQTLVNRGVVPIVAGENYTDELVISQILGALGERVPREGVEPTQGVNLTSF